MCAGYEWLVWVYLCVFSVCLFICYISVYLFLIHVTLLCVRGMSWWGGYLWFFFVCLFICYTSVYLLLNPVLLLCMWGMSGLGGCIYVFSLSVYMFVSIYLANYIILHGTKLICFMKGTCLHINFHSTIKAFFFNYFHRNVTFIQENSKMSC